MYPTKEILSKEKLASTQYSFVNEVVLSTYELALISINKCIKKNTFSINEQNKNMYLI